jgi:hypothetical protein
MGAPMLIPAIGAVAGAALKPNNPLQGALLGAAAGYTGGQALGLTGVAPAIAPAASAVAPAQNALLGIQPAVSASQQSVNALLGMQPTVAGAAAAPVSASTQSLLGVQPMVNAASQGVNAAPSFLDKAGMYAKSAYENPVATGQTFASVNSLLQPEPMSSPAPAMPVQAGRGVKPYDPMAALNPYQQTVVGGPQVSLI